MHARLFLTLVLTLPATACLVPPRLRPLAVDGSVDERAILAHAIFVDRRGHPLGPSTTAKARKLDDTTYGQYLHAMLDSIRADTHRHGGVPPHLVLRVHGGLKTLGNSLRSTLAMRDSMFADSLRGRRYWPLFVNWESSLQSSYGEHLFILRRGRTATTGLSIATSPFVLAADLGAGLARAPLTLARHAELSGARGIFRNGQSECIPRPVVDGPPSTQVKQCDGLTPAESALAPPLIAAQRSEALRAQAPEPRPAVIDTTPLVQRLAASHLPHGSEISFSRFAYTRPRHEMLRHVLVGAFLSFVPPRYYLTWSRDPRRTALGPSLRETPRGAARPAYQLFRALGWIPPRALELIVLDGVGPRAWDVMRRRTKLMSRSADEVPRIDDAVAGFAPARGALAVFLDSLLALTSSDPRYRVTLVGHSMGAIVATEIVRQRDALPLDNIVLMASAASVREVETSIIPYLQRHDSTQFYNLMLHPMAESRESHAFGLIPYGSLLEWIDAYFANPETEFDRMAGKYDGFLRTAFVIPPDVRGRTHLKAFGYRSGKGCGRKDFPFRHGDFNEPGVPYWRESFWKPGGDACPVGDRAITLATEAR